MQNVYKRGNFWWVRFRVGKKRHNISLKTSDHTKAKIRAPQVIAEKRGARSSRTGEQVSWHGFKCDYLKLSRNEQTIYRDTLAFRYLETEFPIQKLEDITPRVLEVFQARLKAQGKQNANVNRLVRSVKTAMKKAEEWELIKPNNWKLVKALKQPTGKLLFWSIQECGRLIRACKGEWRTVTELALNTGMRRSEMFYLRWVNVDFVHGLIHVRPTDDWHPKGFKQRSIPMRANLKAYLQSLPRPSEFVLSRDHIKNEDVLTNYFRKLVKRAKLSGSLHTARHTFASLLVQAGVPLAVVAELLGHSMVRVTAIYSHLGPGNLKDAILKLPEFTA